MRCHGVSWPTECRSDGASASPHPHRNTHLPSVQPTISFFPLRQLPSLKFWTKIRQKTFLGHTRPGSGRSPPPVPTSAAASVLAHEMRILYSSVSKLEPLRPVLKQVLVCYRVSRPPVCLLDLHLFSCQRHQPSELACQRSLPCHVPGGAPPVTILYDCAWHSFLRDSTQYMQTLLCVSGLPQGAKDVCGRARKTPVRQGPKRRGCTVSLVTLDATLEIPGHGVRHTAPPNQRADRRPSRAEQAQSAECRLGYRGIGESSLPATTHETHGHFGVVRPLGEGDDAHAPTHPRPTIAL